MHTRGNQRLFSCSGESNYKVQWRVGELKEDAGPKATDLQVDANGCSWALLQAKGKRMQLVKFYLGIY